MSDQNPTDARFWAQLRRNSTPRDTEPPGPEMVAAYLEGTLDDADAARVEDWLADDALARRIILEDIAAAKEPSPAAVSRAQAVVSESKTGRWFDLGRLLPRPALIASACAILIAFVGALELGASTYGAVRDIDDRVAAALWSADASDEKPS